MRYFGNKEFIFSLITSIVLLVASFVISVYAVNYADRSISNPVTDIILSNTRVHNVDGIFVYGAILLVACIALVCCLRPQRIPFMFKSIALFTFIRSCFISLTHIAPYPEHIAISPSIFTALFPTIFTGDDLFFSGLATSAFRSSWRLSSGNILFGEHYSSRSRYSSVLSSCLVICIIPSTSLRRFS